MTVRDLIKELQEMPQDVPVVTDYHEIEHVRYEDMFYYLNSLTKLGYAVEPGVVLE